MQKYTGTKTMQPFAPNRITPELAEKTIIDKTRKDIVAALEERARDGANGSNKHQWLIIGPRGSGKTHIITVVYNRLARDEELRKKLLVVRLLEDEHGIANFLDFMLRVLGAIERANAGMGWIKEGIAALHNFKPSGMAAEAAKMLFKAAEDRTILIIMENLDMVFDKEKGFGLTGQQALRDLVQQHPRIMLFATAQSLMPTVKSKDAPFHGFFTIKHLDKLSLDDAKTLIRSIAEAGEDENKDEIVKFLYSAEGAGRIEAIYKFTGGNHRLLVVFYKLLSTQSPSSLGDGFISELNILRPFYQERMRSLSSQQQKIVQYLSSEREPRTVGEIADGCFATSNTISSQLKILLDRGFFERIQKGRESYYELKEFLFRIVYEADLEQEGAPVKLFVDFLSGYYTAKELQNRHIGSMYLSRYLSGEDAKRMAADADFYAYAMARKNCEPICGEEAESLLGGEPEGLMGFLWERGAFREIGHFAPHFESNERPWIYLAEADASFQLGDNDKAIQKAEQALKNNPEDFNSHITLSTAFGRMNIKDPRALEHAHKAYEIAPGEPRVLGCIAFIEQMSENYPSALEYAKRFSEVLPDDPYPWRLKAECQKKMGALDEAEASIVRAIELYNNDWNSMYLRGEIFELKGEYEKACVFFQQAAELSKNEASVWSKIGAVRWLHLGQIEEGIIAFEKAAVLDPENEYVLDALTQLYLGTGNHEKTFEMANRLVALSPENTAGWITKAYVEFVNGEIDKSFNSYKKVKDATPENFIYSKLMAFLHYGFNRFEKAISAIDKLLEVVPENAAIMLMRFFCLKAMGQTEDAEKIILKIRGLTPDDPKVYLHIASIRGVQGRFDDVEEMLTEAIEKGEDPGSILIARGEIYRRHKNYAMAIDCYRQAIAAGKEDALPLFNISSSMAGQGNISGAIEELEKAIVIGTNDKGATLILMPALHECMMELFRNSGTAGFRTYLESAYSIAEKHVKREIFMRSLSITVFELLRKNGEISRNRIEKIISAIEEAFGGKEDVSVQVKLLRVGVAHYYDGDKKALLRLTGEERLVFMEELGIKEV